MTRLNRPVVAIVAVTILAAGLRFVHLSHPDGYVFDEVYYPKAACILLGWSDETCTIDPGDEHYWREKKWDVGSWVHPPLGKWEIAMGIKAFGMNEFGWRVSSAVAGTAVVTLTAVMAQLLFGSAIWTALAGLLMAVENLNVVMSRTGAARHPSRVLGGARVRVRPARPAMARAASGRRRRTSAAPGDGRRVAGAGARRLGPSCRPSGGRGGSRREPRSALRPPSSGPARSPCSRC